MAPNQPESLRTPFLSTAQQRQKAPNRCAPALEMVRNGEMEHIPALCRDEIL
jgi:hypothetical protein